MAKLLQLLLPLSVALTVFAFALATRREDGFYLLSHPRQLVRSMLSVHVIMPLLAVVMAALFDLEPALEVALVAVSVAPVSPLAPRKEVKAGGRDSYAIGLFFLTALVAVVTIPAAVQLVGRLFGADIEVPAGPVIGIILITVLLPVAVGVALRGLSARNAERLARPVGIIAGVLLLIAFLPILIGSFRGILSLIGNGTLLAIVGVVAAGLAAGHLLGGPADSDRRVLAVSTVSRHPAVGIAVGTAAAQADALIPAAVLLYLIVSGLATTLYLKWEARGHASPSEDATPRVIQIHRTP